MITPIVTTELCRQLREGSLPIASYLEHLESRFDAREAEVLAFVPEPDRFARLRAEAEALNAKYPRPEERPALFGLPVGVKDIFHAEGFDTLAGSSLPPEELAGEEAAVVSSLKQHGALVLGKTVTTEFAYFAPGPTRNPHDIRHTPGGSSSGSAAAVAAGLAPLALGTQTIGSVNRPAAFCGVVGYKPSYDRISREGVIPVSPSLDHVGLFAMDVAGVQLAAAVVAADWRQMSPSEKPVLGIPEGPYLAHSSTVGQAHFVAACQRLRAAGFVLKQAPVMPDFTEIVDRHVLLMAAEAATVHATWFAQYGHRYHSKTEDLIRRGQQAPVQVVNEARQSRLKLRRELELVMEERAIDLWVSPSAPGPAPLGLDSTGDPIMNLPWTQAGLPTVSLPAGVSDKGLPMGLQVVGRYYQDERLLHWAGSMLASVVAQA